MKVSISKPSDPNPALKCAFCNRARRLVWCLFLSDFEVEMPYSSVRYICDLCIRAAKDFQKHQQFVKTADNCTFCAANSRTVQYMIEGPTRTRICSDCIADARQYLVGAKITGPVPKFTGSFNLPGQ